MPPQCVPVREIGQGINQPVNQTTQPGSEPTQIGVMENALPQINLSISGYEPNSLRDSYIRPPAMRAHEMSILPQLDGPVSLLKRDPI